MYILNIETSTRNCSVSLAKNGETILCREIAELGYSHAEKLHVYIEEIMAEAKAKFSELAAIAVSKGPGSYTGLRIGVSSAKGLCYALEIPLISIDTLQILANQTNTISKIENSIIIPMIDARRMEVYSAVFDENLNKIRETEAQIIDENSFSEIDKTIYIIGDCNEKIKTVLTDSKFVFLDDVQFPSAKEMSAFSFEKLQSKAFEDLAYFEPFYLKDFLITKPKSTV